MEYQKIINLLHQINRLYLGQKTWIEINDESRETDEMKKMINHGKI